MGDEDRSVTTPMAQVVMRAGTAKLKGVLTREEKAGFDELVERKVDALENVEGLRVGILAESDPEERADIQNKSTMGKSC